MPIFEYRCKGCQKDFEAIIRNPEEEAILECPQCRCKDLEKVMSLFSSAGGGEADLSNCGSGSRGFS